MSPCRPRSTIETETPVEPNVAEVIEASSVEAAVAEDERERRLAELYEAAKDENELLEFKNYELLFKIQEMELDQRRILAELSTSADGSTPKVSLRLIG